MMGISSLNMGSPAADPKLKIIANSNTESCLTPLFPENLKKIIIKINIMMHRKIISNAKVKEVSCRIIFMKSMLNTFFEF